MQSNNNNKVGHPSPTSFVQTITAIATKAGDAILKAVRKPTVTQQPPTPEDKNNSSDSDNDLKKGPDRRSSYNGSQTVIIPSSTPKSKPRSDSFSDISAGDFTVHLSALNAPTLFKRVLTKKEKQEKKEKKKREKMEAYLQKLKSIHQSEAQKKRAENAKEQIATMRSRAEQKEAILAAEKLKLKDQQKVESDMRVHNHLEVIESDAPYLMAYAHTQSNKRIDDGHTVSPFRFMCSEVPREILNKTNETLFDIYITALADRIIVLTITLYEFLNNPDPLGNPRELYGYQQEIEALFSKSVLQFLKKEEIQDAIIKKLENAATHSLMESKEDYLLNQDMTTIQLLAKNNILSEVTSAESKVKIALVAQVTSYLTLMIPHLEKNMPEQLSEEAQPTPIDSPQSAPMSTTLHN